MTDPVDGATTVKASLLPSPPQTQALTSKTFKSPPLDGSLTLPEMYDWHRDNTPEHPLFVYSDDDGERTTILWPEAVNAVNRAARITRERMGCDPEKCPDVSAGTPVVAIIAAAGQRSPCCHLSEAQSYSSARYAF